MYRLNECAQTEKVDDRFEWMIRLSLKDDEQVADLNEHYDLGTISEYDEEDDEHSTITQPSETTLGCFDNSSAACGNDAIHHTTHGPSARPSAPPEESCVSGQNRTVLSNSSPVNIPQTALTTSTSQESQIKVKKENKVTALVKPVYVNLKPPVKEPSKSNEFRRFTLDDIHHESAQHALSMSPLSKQPTSTGVGTFSRPVIENQLRKSEAVFQNEMHETIRKLQRMERKFTQLEVEEQLRLSAVQRTARKQKKHVKFASTHQMKNDKVEGSSRTTSTSSDERITRAKRHAHKPLLKETCHSTLKHTSPSPIFDAEPLSSIPDDSGRGSSIENSPKLPIHSYYKQSNKKQRMPSSHYRNVLYGNTNNGYEAEMEDDEDTV